MKHFKNFTVTVKGFDNQGLLISFDVPVLATTTWHAIELAYRKYCKLQPNRGMYYAR